MSSNTMPSSSPIPTGKLMTGSVGAFMLGAGMLLIGLVFMMMFGGDPSAAEGFLFLMAPLMSIGGVLTLFGYVGFQRVFGGANLVAGVLALLAGLAGAGILLLPLLSGAHGRQQMDFIVLGFLSYGVASSLFGLVGGVAALGSKDGRPAASLRAAGVLLLVGGLLGVPMTLALAEVIPLASWVIPVGLLSPMVLGVGAFLAGTAMLGRRASLT